MNYGGEGRANPNVRFRKKNQSDPSRQRAIIEDNGDVGGNEGYK